MIKKSYTREQRYTKRMADLNFLRKKFWVHKDDYEKVHKYMTRLRQSRLRHADLS
jgi:hypothetical protein